MSHQKASSQLNPQSPTSNACAYSQEMPSKRKQRLCFGKVRKELMGTLYVMGKINLKS